MFFLLSPLPSHHNSAPKSLSEGSVPSVLNLALAPSCVPLLPRLPLYSTELFLAGVCKVGLEFTLSAPSPSTAGTQYPQV